MLHVVLLGNKGFVPWSSHCHALVIPAQAGIQTSQVAPKALHCTTRPSYLHKVSALLPSPMPENNCYTTLMPPLNKNDTAFSKCQNRFFRVEGADEEFFSLPARVICPLYLEGVPFDKKEIVDTPGDGKARRDLANRLGCAACPYAEVVMIKTIANCSDGQNQTVTEIRFEPVEDTM